MGATRYLTSEHVDGGARAAAAPGKTRLVASREDLAMAAAVLTPAGADTRPASRAGALALPAVVHALVAHHGALSIDEYRPGTDAKGRPSPVATGRKLTGLQALQALRRGFGANNAFRGVDLDTRAVARSNALAIPAEARNNEARLEEAVAISATRDPRTPAPMRATASGLGAIGSAKDAKPSSRAARWNAVGADPRGR